jgi:nitroimidazol reductase NimA-like FMN-containing flavoprotein (pyridoxamine 5'-phosphate oxidase superfamily)
VQVDPAPPASLAPTERTTVKRLPERGRHDRATIDAILDEAFICHLGFETERGPVVIPTSYGREGDTLFIHGSPASRMLRSLKRGVPVCVTVTLVDGLVLARSTFHHSINYRSVVVFGTASEVTDPARKQAALAAVVEHIVPGRTAEARPATPKEAKGTLVLALPLTEASAKVRTGPPIDDPEDLEWPTWAGVLPLSTALGAPLPDEHVAAGVPVAPSVAGYRRP